MGRRKKGDLLVKIACMHAKSPQSCSTLCDPMDYVLPGSPIHGILEFKNTRVDCHALLLQGIFPTQGSNPGISYVSCISRWVLYDMCHLGKPNSWGHPLSNPSAFRLVLSAGSAQSLARQRKVPGKEAETPVLNGASWTKLRTLEWQITFSQNDDYYFLSSKTQSRGGIY